MEFRLSAFISVARNLNFTKAAKELHISQPAISKHIQELETHYNIQLFNRLGNKVSLTAAGEVFLKRAESIIEEYNILQVEMGLLTGNLGGTLRIGASTSIAKYVLPPILAKFISRFPNVQLSMLTGNSEQIETALNDHKIDIGLVEGSSRKTYLKYICFAKDELVMVTNSENKAKDEVSVEELAKLPLVLREVGSGTLEVFENALLEHKIKLSQMNILLHLGETESIKSFLLNSSAYAIVSIVAILNELKYGKLKVVEITDLELEREFAFVIPAGNKNEVVERFMQFVSLHYKKTL